ncbi:MAG TPA: hypothetical protein VGE11_22030 [Pseudonocardia sp.]
MDDPRFLGLFGGIVLVGVLLLLLRWTWGTGRHLPIPDPNDPVGDGLLAEVARAPTETAAQVLRSRLTTAGIRATIGRDGGSYRVMVFDDDAGQAKLVLRE